MQIYPCREGKAAIHHCHVADFHPETCQSTDRQNEGTSGGGGGTETTFPHVITDLCADQRSQVTGYKTPYYFCSDFHIQPCSYQTGFVIHFHVICHANMKLTGILHNLAT